MAGLFPRILVRDSYLAEDEAAALLAHALANEAAFDAAKVTAAGKSDVVKAERDGLMHTPPDDLLSVFRTRMERDFTTICSELGIRPFQLHSFETYMTAHGDGGFFHEHMDAMTAKSRAITDSDRIVSLILYLHAEPKAFSGGELCLRDFAAREKAVEIEPAHNRLVALPSIAPHSIARVGVPSGAYSDSRFAVNCFFRRARG